MEFLKIERGIILMRAQARGRKRNGEQDESLRDLHHVRPPLPTKRSCHLTHLDDQVIMLRSDAFFLNTSKGHQIQIETDLGAQSTVTYWHTLPYSRRVSSDSHTYSSHRRWNTDWCDSCSMCMVDHATNTDQTCTERCPLARYAQQRQLLHHRRKDGSLQSMYRSRNNDRAAVHCTWRHIVWPWLVHPH